MIKDILITKGMTRDEVNELVGNYLKFIDNKIENTHYAHKWKCKCGNTFKRPWSRIKYNKNCICEECRKQSQINAYIEEVEKDGDYEYIRYYKNGDILPSGKIVKGSPYIQVKHKYCGSIYEIKTRSFINNKGKCNKCCGSYKNSFAYHIEVELGESLEKYWDFDKNTVNPYHIWKSSGKKVWVKCQKVDYHGSYEVSCNNFINDSRCSYCGCHKVHPLDSFGYHNFDKVMSWHTDNNISPFKVSSASGKKYKFICETCGNIFHKVIYSIKNQNQWCPNCTSSKGERRVSSWLRLKNIEYESEKTFDHLVSDIGSSLRYDFYLPGYNLLIEYDGIQHDKWVEGLMTEEGFKRLQYHDKLKNEYAANNGIKLIRIKAKDFDNIEDILNKEMVTWQINNKKMRENMVKN